MEYNRRLVEEMKKRYDNCGDDEDNDAKIVGRILMGAAVIGILLFIVCVVSYTR